MTRPLFGAALTALAVTLTTGAAAQRLQPTVVAVVDTDRVRNTCNACRTALTQLQTQATALETRQTALYTPLQPEANAIQTALQGLGTRQPDAALQKRITDFNTKKGTADQELATGQRRLQSIRAHILQQINVKLGPIVRSVMTTRGASVVVDSGAALTFAPGVDVTADVLTQLNQQLPTLSVTPLPQQTPPAAAPQGR